MADIDSASKEQNITTIKQAQEMCKAKFGKLPRMGYESLIHEGTAKRNDGFGGMVGEYKCQTRTYLQHNGNGFRVWTWVNVNPITALTN